jgi:hypothetical protein
VFAVDNHRNTGQAGGQHPFEKGSPRMSVDDIRPLTPKQLKELPRKPYVVSVPPVQLEDRNGRPDSLLERPGWLCAANHAANACRVEAIDQLDDAVFHAPLAED